MAYVLTEIIPSATLIITLRVRPAENAMWVVLIFYLANFSQAGTWWSHFINRNEVQGCYSSHLCPAKPQLCVQLNSILQCSLKNVSLCKLNKLNANK